MNERMNSAAFACKLP